jgi:hypothetical protein
MQFKDLINADVDHSLCQPILENLLVQAGFSSTVRPLR